MPGSIKIDDGSGNYTILTNAGSLGSDKTLTIPNSTATLATTTDVNNVTPGITEADMWRKSANQTHPSNAVISSDWERADTDGAGYFGTGLTESSGVFTFPSTGFYHIHFHFMFIATDSAGFGIALQTTLNNSSYDDAASANEYTPNVANTYASASGSFIFDVTDTSTHKFRFNGYVITGGAPTMIGNSGQQNSGFTVMRLGDT